MSRLKKFTFFIVLLGALAVGIALGVLNNRDARRAEAADAQHFTVLAGANAPGGIELLAFAPQSLKVHRGDTVTWINQGFHNLRFDSTPAELIVAPEVDGQPLPQFNPVIAFPTIETGAAYQGGIVNAGLPIPDGFSLVIDVEPGAYAYLCDVHPGMVGMIEVVADDQPIPNPTEVMLQGAGEIGASLVAAFGASAELEGNAAAMMTPEGDASIQAGSEGPGRITINQFFPFLVTIKAGQSVTWTNPAGSLDPHFVGWPSLAGQEIAPTPVEGGPPMLTLGPTFIPSIESGAALTPGMDFNSGALFPGQTFSLTFPEAGVYPYLCHIHPGMNGVVVVNP